MRNIFALANAVIDAVRNTFNFDGRTSRRGFWLFVSSFLMFHGLAFSLSCLIHARTANDIYFRIVFPLICIPLLALSVRRMHDASRFAVWAFPMVALLFLSNVSQRNLKHIVRMYFLDAPGHYLLSATFLILGALLFGFITRSFFPSIESDRHGVKPGVALSGFVSPPTFKTQTRNGMLLLLFISAGLWAVSREWVDYKSTTGIFDYRPVDFTEKAASPFFYTIGNLLKHGVSIDANAPTLFSGKPLTWYRRILHMADKSRLRVYPSPDNRKAAVVSDRKLYLVQPNKESVLVLENVDIPEEKPLFGDTWYRSISLQWDSASRYIYIIHDKELTPSGTKKRDVWKTSRDAVLERIDTENALQAEKVVDNFSDRIGANFYDTYFYYYFLVNDASVCFRETGQWKCATRDGRFLIKSYSADEILLENGARLRGRQSLSVEHHNRSRNVNERDWYCHSRGERAGFLDKYSDDLFLERLKEGDRFQDGLFSRDKPDAPLIVFKRFHSNMRMSECNGLNTHQSGMLPGGRYLYLKLGYFYPIEILLDRLSGDYRELPEDTWVYVNDVGFPHGKKLTPADLMPASLLISR